MKYEKLAEGILALLNGIDYDIRMYKGSDGKRTSNPYEARYFYVKNPNIMFIIDEAINTLIVHKANLPFVKFKELHKSIRGLCRRYFVNFEVRDYNKAFTPKDFSPIQMKKEFMSDTINESKRQEVINEKYKRENNYLQIVETSDSMAYVINQERKTIVPYKDDHVHLYLVEQALKTGELPKSFVRRIYSLHETWKHLTRKYKSCDNVNVSKKEMKLLKELNNLFK